MNTTPLNAESMNTGCTIAAPTTVVRQVFVDKGNCTSCGLCAETHPQYFRMDEDDLAESHNRGANPNTALVHDDHRRTVQVAINDCPGECIHWNARS